MKKSSKKLIASVMACTLVGALAFNGTLAYLTDTEGATNVVTVGKVQIDLEEPGYPGNNSDEVKRVIPNQEIVKDPQVENTGNNAALIYLKVEIPQENFTEMSLDGTLGEKKMQDLFALKGLDGDWELVKTEPSTNADTQKTKTTYVYAYRKPLEKGTTTSKLFDKVQMKNAIENDLSGNVEDIVVTACAIQATDIPGENLTVDKDGYLGTATLTSVYKIFMNQSGDKDVRPADDGNRTQTGKLGTITYNLGDDASLNDALYEYSTADYGYVPPTPTRENYIFAGWEPEQIAADSVGDISFTAKWEASMTATLETRGLYKKVKNIAETTTEITAFLHSDTKPTDENMTDANVISDRKSETPIYLWRDGTALKWWSKAGNVNAGSDLYRLFEGYSSLTDISGLADWNTESVATMAFIFKDCKGLTDLSALGNWKIGSVTFMSGMFDGCESLVNLNALESWNTGNVIGMDNMFCNCISLTDLSGLSKWDTGSVTDMNHMFEVSDDGSKLTNLSGLERWNTGSVMHMSCMFKGRTSLAILNALESWNTGNVIDMDNMFCNCISLTDLSGLSKWDTGSVTDMSEMFGNCYKLTGASAINDWDIATVKDFGYMFTNCPYHPTFTKRAGTWDEDGTFTPTS